MTKISRFNHFQRWRDGYYIAYNARSGAVAVMTEENYRTYGQLAEKLASLDGAPALTAAEEELLRQLEYGRFAYPEQKDEWEAIKFQHGLDRFDQTRLGLVVAPTMACNMACEYCYEGNKKGKMTPEVVESLIDFVDKQSKTLQSVDISWYGGEPLLALDVIEDLTLTLLDLAKEKEFTYTSTMISNGSLLTREVADRLAELKVSMIQVTIDGPERMHNQKRPLKNGKASFETILGNIDYASTKMAITARVNVDKSYKAEMIAELLEELKRAGLQRKVAVYFGQLEPASTVCANIADACYDTAAFSRVEIDFYRLLLNNDFRIEKLPTPTSAFCMASQLNGYVVDPEGNLYRCFNYVGDSSKSMGNIRQPIDYQHPNFTRLFNFDPFESERCRNCCILPVCMGGCPAHRADRKLTDEEICQSWKHNLAPMLEIIAGSRQQRMQQASEEQR